MDAGATSLPLTLAGSSASASGLDLSGRQVAGWGVRGEGGQGAKGTCEGRLALACAFSAFEDTSIIPSGEEGT